MALEGGRAAPPLPLPLPLVPPEKEELLPIREEDAVEEELLVPGAPMPPTRGELGTLPGPARV